MVTLAEPAVSFGIDQFLSENVMRAECDGAVKKMQAAPTDSLAVDQVIWEFDRLREPTTHVNSATPATRARSKRARPLFDSPRARGYGIEAICKNMLPSDDA